MDILCYARLPLPSRAVEPRKGLLKHMYCLPLGYRPVGVFCFRFCINGRVLIWIFVWCYRFLFLSFSFLSYFFQMYKSVLVFYRVMISLCTYFFPLHVMQSHISLLYFCRCVAYLFSFVYWLLCILIFPLHIMQTVALVCLYIFISYFRIYYVVQSSRRHSFSFSFRGLTLFGQHVFVVTGHTRALLFTPLPWLRRWARSDKIKRLTYIIQPLVFDLFFFPTISRLYT